MAFGTVACKSQWLFQLSEICNSFFSHGFASCRGSAQSLFFRFQDCRLAPSNPSLQRPVAFPPVVLQTPMALPAVADLHSALFFRFPNCRLTSSNPFLQRLIASCRGSAQSPFFPLPRLPLGPFKPFSVHSLLERLLATWLFQLSGICTESFFSASKTAAPLQTLPCSVQRPFHLLSCKCHWLCQLSGICIELFFLLPRLPLGPFKRLLANAHGFSSCRGFFSASKTAAWQDRRLALPAASCGKCQWFP